jgi:hypothetical protein
MTTDNKTLADVRPGGRVRLGDQARVTISDELLTRMAYAIPGAVESTDKAKAVAARVVEIYLSAQPSPDAQAAHCPVKHCGMTYARVPADGRCHACGATVQPSPGGQGNELTELTAKWRRESKERFGKNEFSVVAESLDVCAHELEAALAARQPVRIYGCCAQPEGELHTAECPNMRHLAARQPVGQEPVAVVGPDFALFWFGSGPIAPLVERNGLRPGSKLYAAPPAQAVDLGKYRHALLRASGWARRSDVTSHVEDAGLLRELLALIDGKAVGK